MTLEQAKMEATTDILSSNYGQAAIKAGAKAAADGGTAYATSQYGSA